MISELKIQIEKKIGTKIENRGDCELLSNAILDVLEIDLSYNTIRRFYGLAPYTKPNSKTLNTLTQFIGYKNYAHFSQNYEYNQKIDLSQITYKAISVGDEVGIINLVTKTKKSPENFIGFIVLLIRELFHNKNYGLVDDLFKLDALSFNSFSYSEVLYIGNSLGLFLRKKPKIESILLKNTNFLDCVYLTFVDYSSLNGYYGEWTETIKHNKPENKIALFSSAILEFKSFLNQKPVKHIEDDLMYSTQLHPILCSRLLALKLLVIDTGNTIETLNAYFEVHADKTKVIDYAFELFTTAILTKNFLLMKYLIEKLNLYTSKEFYYQKHHLNSFYLMCMFYFKHTKNSTEEKKYNSLFSINNCRYSYEEFITLLYQVYVFRTTKIGPKKELIKKKYSALRDQLNYPYFSESYLLNYFD